METPRTTWEAKERDGLLTFETDAWRKKRRIAEDPHTTAEALGQLASEALDARKQARFRKSPRPLQQSDEWRQCDLLLETLAGHCNTPPHFFPHLIGLTASSTEAFCRNPVAPFLLLEQPNFLSSFDTTKLAHLLSAETAPLIFVQSAASDAMAQKHPLSQKACRRMQETARLHVVLAGEVSTADAWRRQLIEHWQSDCALAAQEPEDLDDRQWFADLVEMGLAPSWANGPQGPPLLENGSMTAYTDTSDTLLNEWFAFDFSPGSDEETSLLNRIGPRVQDKEVLARALRASATPADMMELMQMPGSKTVITCRALLRHPAVDGNVIQALPRAASWHDQRLIAAHPKAPTEVIAHLSESQYPDVRRLARRHPRAPADAAARSRASFLDRVWNCQNEAPPELGIFIACLHKAIKPTNVQWAATGRDWTYRLGGTLQVAATDDPLPGDLYARTGLDLLNHLSRDGNRLVRWAAHTRLADPDFTFQF